MSGAFEKVYGYAPDAAQLAWYIAKKQEEKDSGEMQGSHLERNFWALQQISYEIQHLGESPKSLEDLKEWYRELTRETRESFARSRA